MSDVRGSVWSDWEVDAIVADYFDMLAEEFAGRGFNKSEHRRALQTLIGREPGSIERKHQNISAVLERLGMPFIRGYKPLAHFQNSLLDAVETYLTSKGQPVLQFAEAVPKIVAEAPSLWIGPAPEVLSQEHNDPERLRQLVRKFDPAERDARNRKLGKQGEKLVYIREQHELRAAGRDDLARKVEWTSEVRGDGAGYDIQSFELDGRERLIEVKTTNGPAKTPFFSFGERTRVQRGAARGFSVVAAIQLRRKAIRLRTAAAIVGAAGAQSDKLSSEPHVNDPALREAKLPSSLTPGTDKGRSWSGMSNRRDNGGPGQLPDQIRRPSSRP